MRRYFLKFSYNGSQYRGLQKQSDLCVRNVDTIQGTLESALQYVRPKCLNNPKLVLCSRTDAGVHAFYNNAHVDLTTADDTPYDTNIILNQINGYLKRCGHYIRLLDFIPVTNEFHVRSLVKSRTYIYRFMTAKEKNISMQPPVAEIPHTFHLKSDIFDIEKVKHATRLFLGTKDFTTFSAKKHSPCKPNYVRSLNYLRVEEAQPLMSLDPLSKNFNFWHIVCNSNSFLYQQVRRISAALIEVGTNKITERDINIMLQVPSHKNWDTHIQPTPGYGLYLAEIKYDEDELKNYFVK